MKKITKVHFDIIHLCHFNFFKNAILECKKRGYDVDITFIDRGKIEKVLAKEIPHFKTTKIGTYRPTTAGKVPMILERWKLFNKYLKKSKPDITTGVGDFILAFTSRLKGIPSVMFYDDFEFKINYRLSQVFGNVLIVPFPLPKDSKKIRKYKSFKELAYLHPSVYKPKIKIIKDLKLKKDNYVFAREVAGISMNYSGMEQENLLPFIKYLHDKRVKVILSLEDKSRKELYEPYCEILEEPLEDLYSIMAYARFAISSGDSMARESALLGVPCIYTGGRTMYVNKPFLKWKAIYKIESPVKILSTIDKLMKPDSKKGFKARMDKKIKNNLIPATTVIMKSIEEYRKK